MIYNPAQPSFHILISLIQIWAAKSTDPMSEPDVSMYITEVEEISIEDNYKSLINKATVRFPLGTVLRKTLHTANLDEYSAKLTANVREDGVVEVAKDTAKIISQSDFQVGSRIRIMLGYTTDPRIAALAKIDQTGRSIHNDATKMSEYKKHLTTMFEGYISLCSVDANVEIQCENLARVLKTITCPKVAPSGNKTVNDFLSAKGQYKLLKGTGLSLHPDTEASDINIGKVSLTTDLTVADVLTEWAKYKVYAFVSMYDGKPCIKVGRTYFSSMGKDSIFTKEAEAKRTILFDYHVAQNGLKAKPTDKMFLAVEASSYDANGKAYHITIRKNPQWDSSKPAKDQWQVMNETTLSKKAMKLGATPLTKSRDKVDLSTYTVIPYMSRKIGISKEELLQEAIKYFESYNMNGIDGTLTIFGDLFLQSGQKVRLYDKRRTFKNGYYLTDEVTTTFGSKGFRQQIKLPYLIARDKQ